MSSEKPSIVDTGDINLEPGVVVSLADFLASPDGEKYVRARGRIQCLIGEPGETAADNTYDLMNPSLGDQDTGRRLPRMDMKEVLLRVPVDLRKVA